jgi:hypothetical protein
MSSLPPTSSVEDIARDAWPRALARWSPFLLLGDPEVRDDLPAIAQVHLGTRVVSLHGPLIARHKLTDCVEALLAHEVGHHVRYPATLATEVRLRTLERALIPWREYSLVNMFTDLLINEHLGGALSGEFTRVYRALIHDVDWQGDPAFLFTLSTYECLWRLPPGAILGRHADAFFEAYPSHRADAELLAQDLFPLAPSLYTQYLFFASVVSRYLQPRVGDVPVHMIAQQCARGDASPDDHADALTPSAEELEAIERAAREGWLSEREVTRLRDENVLSRRISGLPGQETADARAVPEVMAAYYRQQAERLLFRPPSQRRLGEAVVPTTPEPWEPGDPLQSIDWRATLTQLGATLGAATPLRRDVVADREGLEVPTWQPRMEIYLDVSGSMPDPIATLNAMTLAAVILAVATLRAGGEVRGLVYSTGVTAAWAWCRSEVEITRFFMHYIGAGTEFPFEVLRDSVDECRERQPVRVVITDRDFDANHDASPEHGRVFSAAARARPAFVMLLHHPKPERVRQYAAAGASVVPVADLADFPRMAARLAQALFPAGAA